MDFKALLLSVINVLVCCSFTQDPRFLPLLAQIMASNAVDEYDDEALLQLIANLDLNSVNTVARVPSPPRTPPPPYQPVQLNPPNTVPRTRPAAAIVPTSPALYRYDSPTQSGVTPD
ncbi:hypothetical protein R3P38DRAFT_3267568, partial [Favolaschia claudopus]